MVSLLAITVSFVIDYPEVIRARARSVIDGAANDDVGVYRMIRNLVETTKKEYRGRFLHELIQNGYDAHPQGTRDGKVAVEFDDEEGEFGVLYVANGGNPLSQSNFERMASLGDSDKPIGEAVGNKGVGFKSVFQICDAPEVFSISGPDDPSFSGFSFRFGTESDLDVYTDLDDVSRARISEDLSLSLLTVPLADTPTTVDTYRNRGFVTVLRLPISRPQAANEVRERIKDLLASPSPVMLFLDRLTELSVRVSAQAEVALLTRDEELLDGSKHVTLNGSQRFLVYDGVVDKRDLDTALGDAVDAGALDRHWLAWSAEATVSVAIADGWQVDDPHAFTFLPMGPGATAPLGGHINAPFVTDFNRLSLDLTNPVNALLMRRVAEVCVQAASRLIDARWRPNEVVDLLAWHPDYLEWVSNAATELRNEAVFDLLQLPVFGHDTWKPLSELLLWQVGSTEVVTPANVAAGSGPVLIDTTELDPVRLERLRSTTRDSRDLEPTSQDIAAWVEQMAKRLLGEAAALETWRSFYDDLPELFSDGEPLRGRRFLLSDTHELLMAPLDGPDGNLGRRRRGLRQEVFFAPRRAGTEDSEDEAIESDSEISPPRALAKRIVFLHPGLKWHDGSQQTPGRRFLQASKLALPFRSYDLLAALKNILADTESTNARRAALRFAYSLLASNPDRYGKELAGVGLYVPTAQGSWILASDARFSRAWGVQGSADLEDIAANAPPGSELEALQDVLLAAPSELAGSAGNVARWSRFLGALGVTVALPIRSVTDSRRIQGRYLEADSIAASSMASRLPPRLVDQWRSGITAAPTVDFRYTDFQTQDSTFWFLGQHEVTLLPARARIAYARAVARSLSALQPVHRASTWKRASRRDYDVLVETPLWAFVTAADWVPVQQSGGGRVDFRSPQEAWFVGVEDNLAASYSPLLESTVRKLATTGEVEIARLSATGIHQWTDPGEASSLIDHLHAVFATNDIPGTVLHHFRSSLATAWGVAIEQRQELPECAEHELVVEHAGELALAPPEETLYISSIKDESTSARLVRELNWAVLPVDAPIDALSTEFVDELRELRAGHAYLTAEWDLKLTVDGRDWVADPNTPSLVTELPWLPLVLAACLRYPRSSGLAVGKHLPEILDALGSIRFLRATSVSVGSSDRAESLPARLGGILAIPGEIPTVVGVGVGAPPTWDELERVVRGVLELLGQERFKAEVSLTIRNLSPARTEEVSPPSVAALARALDISVRQIDEVASIVNGSHTGVLERLRTIAPAMWGSAALSAFDRLVEKSGTIDDIHDLLANLSGPDASVVLDAASKAATADELRRQLGIGIQEFNLSLTAHFPELAVIDNTEHHADDFRLRVHATRTAIIDRLRNARVDVFDALQVQADWGDLFELAFLSPDPDWGREYDDVPTEVVDARIADQMSARLGALGPSHRSLPPLSDVETANGRRLRTALTETRSLVAAWCTREGRVLPSAWTEDAFEEALWLRLKSAGALDFRVLSRGSLGEWLDRVGAWPEGMPASADSEDHDLTADELTREMSAEATQRSRKTRASQQIRFRDATVDLDDGLSAVVDHVSAMLLSEPSSLDSPYRVSELEGLVRGRRAGSATVGARRGSRTEVMRLSSAQTSAIGLVGEMIAFHWLKAKDPSGQVDSTCWKSTNCRHIFPGAVGDDGLGYDFEVPRKGGAVMYEVKATSGDAGMIELGETEVRRAQQAARSDRWRLIIVEEALSDEPRVHLLPNPFREESRELFQFVGNSIRLKFSVATGAQ